MAYLRHPFLVCQLIYHFIHPIRSTSPCSPPCFCTPDGYISVAICSISLSLETTWKIAWATCPTSSSTSSAALLPASHKWRLGLTLPFPASVPVGLLRAYSQPT